MFEACCNDLQTLALVVLGIFIVTVIWGTVVVLDGWPKEKEDGG